MVLIVPLSFLYLRLILSIMFIDSGRRHLLNPVGRAKSIGLPVWFTIALGAVEVSGGVLILSGWYTQTAAFFLSGVMVGAIYFKLFIWKTGIYGKPAGGWYYDALLLGGVGVLFALGAGDYSLDTLLS
ncbi:MAG: DoxX family protein [Candidatus Paceibacteria bacterium]